MANIPIATRDRDFLRVFKILEKTPDAINDRDESQWTALHYATYLGEEDVVGFLLKKGAQLDARNSDGVTPLMMAATLCQDKIAKLLVERNASLNLMDTDGQTALHMASELGHMSVVEYLVTRGAMIDARNKEGKTALHHALKGRYISMVNYLVEQKAGLDIQDNEGATPLHYASKKGLLSVVAYLVRHGATFDVTDKKKRAPADVACEDFNEPDWRQTKKNIVGVLEPKKAEQLRREFLAAAESDKALALAKCGWLQTQHSKLRSPTILNGNALYLMAFCLYFTGSYLWMISRGVKYC